MNHSQQSGFPGLVSNKVLTREYPLIRKTTNVGANRIQLTLPDACFFEDDCIEGTLLLDLKTRMNAKRITLQFIGELSYVLQEQPDSPDRVNPSPNSPLGELIDHLKLSSPTENRSLRRSNTQGSRPITTTTLHDRNAGFSEHINPPLSSRPMIRRSLSGIPVRNKKLSHAASLLHSVSKVYPSYKQPTQPNTDVFCHYSVPLYTFRQKCPPGRYYLPFSFEFDDLVLPTTNFSRENLQLFIKYLVIAEVEEDGDDNDDSFCELSDQDSEEEEAVRPRRFLFEKRGNLKCQAVIEILWNYAIHIRESDLYSRSEVSQQKIITIPRYFCSCFSYTALAVLKIPKTIITLGDKVPFSLQLSNAERNLNFNVEVNLLEEISNLVARVNDRNVLKLVLSSKSTKSEGGCVTFNGEIDFGAGVNVYSLISNEWNINHTLQFKIVIKKLLEKTVEKIAIPCLIVPDLTPKQIRRMTGEKAEGRSMLLDDTTDDDILHLPHCKFNPRLSARSNSRERSPQDSQAETVKKQYSQPLLIPERSKTRRPSISGQKENIRALNLSSMQPPSFYYVLQSNRAFDSNHSQSKRQNSPNTKRDTPQKKSYNNLSTIALNEEIQALGQKLLEKEKELMAEKQKCVNYQRVTKQYKDQIYNGLTAAKEMTLDIQQNPALLFQRCTELCLAQEELKRQVKMLEESIRQETLISEEHRTRAQIMKRAMQEQRSRDSIVGLSKGEEQMDPWIDFSELKLENEHLKKALEEVQDKCDHLQLVSDEAEVKTATLEKKLIAMAQTSETLRLENENLIEEKNRLLEYIEQNGDSLRLQNQIDIYRTQDEKLQRECIELGDKLRRLEEKNYALASERETIMEIVRERELEINDNIARLNEIKMESLDLKREMNLNQENFSVLTLTLSETQEELERANKKNRELEKEVTQLENFIEIMKVESKHVENNKIEDLKQKIQTLLQM